MKRISLLLFIFFLSGSIVHAQVKIGVINSQEIFAKSDKGIAIQDKLDILSKRKQDELSVMQDEIKKLESQLISPALNESSREKKAMELQTLRTNLKRTIEDAQREFQSNSQKSLTDLEKEIMPILISYGRNNGFTVIYDIDRSGIIYYDEAINITKEIIKILNQ